MFKTPLRCLLQWIRGGPKFSCACPTAASYIHPDVHDVLGLSTPAGHQYPIELELSRLPQTTNNTPHVEPTGEERFWSVQDLMIGRRWDYSTPSQAVIASLEYTRQRRRGETLFTSCLGWLLSY
jgi:hypothetical protein